MKKIYMITAAALFATSTAFAAMDERPMVLPVTAMDRNEADITQQLKELGYTKLSQVRMSGDIYTATAFWDGEPLSIRIDDKTGRIQNAKSSAETIPSDRDATQAEIKSRLEGLGYTNVREMTTAGSIHRVTASRDGMVYNLRVDAQTGIVTSSRDRTQPSIGNAEGLSDRQIADELAELGFHNARGMEREGNVISVKAMHDGEEKDLNIDARNGAVTVVN